MYPEAGGSSSFARHAFNEFWSFFAAWGQMLNYVITIAISAFFVPHYIGGLFWPALRHSPGDIIFGIVVIVRPRRDQHRRRQGVGGRQRRARGHRLPHPAAAGDRRAACSCFSPQTLVDNVHLGVAPTWKDFLVAIPVGMIAYTGIETISNMAEEAKDEAQDDPAAINRVVIAVFAIYALLPAVALSALPVTCDGNGKCQTLLGLPESKGGFAGDPVLGIVKHLDLGPAAARGRDLRRPAGGDDPVHRHQRRDHRRLAARLLDGHPPPGARPAAPAAPEVPHAVDRDPRVRRDRVPRR